MITNSSMYTTKYEDEQNHDNTGAATKVFGFWIYLMSDCILFSCLFATYAVLFKNTASGPISKDIYRLPFVLVETILLLFSSVTYGMAMVSMHKKQSNQIVIWLGLTWLFGTGFIGMEIYEFRHLIMKGFSPDRSGFLSAFFALVGAHGLHVVAGLIWIAVLIFQIVWCDLTDHIQRTRVTCLSLFWHFLDIIWICVFSIIYLMGAIV